MKILAVDDEPDILEILRLVLRGSGHSDFTSATSAGHAINLIKDAAEPFDCFLLDIQMPEVTGIDLCRWIRKQAKYRATPILMITAMMNKSHIDRAFVAGATDYVTKPIDLTEFGARIRTAEQVVSANKRMKNAALEAQDARAELEASKKFALPDAIALDDVEGLIELLALENYLLQLSRGNLFATSVIAIHVDKAGDLYARCSPTLFRDVLADVAESVLAALVGTNCILAYAGNGTFAGIMSNAQELDAEEIELIINGILDGLQLLDDRGRPLEVLVAVGHPQVIGVMQSGKGAVNLLHRAIAEMLWSQPRSASKGQPALSADAGFLKSLFRARG